MIQHAHLKDKAPIVTHRSPSLSYRWCSCAGRRILRGFYRKYCGLNFFKSLGVGGKRKTRLIQRVRISTMRSTAAPFWRRIKTADCFHNPRSLNERNYHYFVLIATAPFQDTTCISWVKFKQQLLMQFFWIKNILWDVSVERLVPILFRIFC